jgi:TPR repeat protein
MKAMSKQQLADRAGVSVRTLNSWCRPYQRELQEMGVTPRMKVLPPHDREKAYEGDTKAMNRSTSGRLLPAGRKNLGVCYERGEGVKVNLEIAFDLPFVTNPCRISQIFGDTRNYA